MTDLNADPWIAANSELEPEKLHALGVITLTWNSCEVLLRLLLCCVSARSFADVWADTFGARSSEVSGQIRKLVIRSLKDDAVKNAVLYALTIYDINRLNRNQFSHFLSSGNAKGGTDFYNKKNPNYAEIFDLPAIRSNLEDIRRVALEIKQLRRYLAELANVFSKWFHASLLEPPPPLPEKPPQPERLWTPPQRPSKSASPRQPKPSRA